MTSKVNAFVSVNWLKQCLSEPQNNLVILDATLAPVGVDPQEFADRACLPNAINFDIKQFSDEQSSLPHTLLNQKKFQHEVQKLGINNNNIIVVYDAIGVYSSPRAWWNFKIFGHEQIYILDGGLPAWLVAGFETTKHHKLANVKGNFKANFRKEYVIDEAEILRSLNSQEFCILDARAEKRFSGEQPEPRAGIRSGHIPNSINIPFQQVLNDTHIKATEKLKDAFKQPMRSNSRVICSCGSGITACILIAAAYEAGLRNLSLYDGSWSQWGASQNPISHNKVY